MDLINLISGSDRLVPDDAAVSFLVVLTIVVFVHEFGHFWVGRRCGVGVTAFSIGFGPELFGWTDRHGTRWKISAIPLGGYVKFVGDVNAASVPDTDALDQMTPKPSAPSASRTRASPSAPRSSPPGRSPTSSSRSSIFAGLNYADGRQVLEPRIESRRSRRAPPNGPASSRATSSCRSTARAIDSFSDMQRWVSASAGRGADLHRRPRRRRRSPCPPCPT